MEQVRKTAINYMFLFLLPLCQVLELSLVISTILYDLLPDDRDEKQDYMEVGRICKVKSCKRNAQVNWMVLIQAYQYQCMLGAELATGCPACCCLSSRVCA